MPRASCLFPGIALWACLAGCSNKPLQDRGPAGVGGISLDGGMGGSGASIGGGGGQTLPPADGGTPDATADLSSDRGLPTTGQRSYLVTSLLQRDGGIGSAPTSHTFTLVLDADRRTAIAGGAAEGKSVSLEQTASGALHVVGPLTFTINPDSCSGSSVTYTDLTFTVDGSDRLTGTGTGTLYVSMGDTGLSAGATMSLMGAADTQAPTLTISGGFSDPLLPFTVRASEPLPPSTSAVLRAADGEIVALSAVGTIGSFVTAFNKPITTLRYGTQYQVIVDTLTDFVGNTATGTANLFFFTKALPPVGAEDGFESLTGTTFAGVSVLSSADGPVIAGAKSLYIPGAPAGTLTTPPTQPELMLRVRVSPGNTNIRFAYRMVMGSGLSYGGAWLLGSERGAATTPAYLNDTGTTTTDVMVGGKTWTLGPITTASFALPAGATNEVIVQRTFTPTWPCGRPPAGVNGLLIDDLRAE